MRITSALTISIASLAPPAAAAETPQQFDLVCRSKTSTVSADIKPIEKTNDARFSVDLGQKVWCRHQALSSKQHGACAKVQPIATVGGDVLTLSNKNGAEGDNRLEVDVKSGVYSALIRVRPGVMPEIVSTAKGRCTLAPLTAGML